MISRLVAGLILLGLIAFAPRADADPLADTVLRLKPGTIIRVVNAASYQHQGTLLRANSDSLYMAVSTSQLGIPLADVRDVWTHGRATKTGAILGGLIGGLGGVVLAETVQSGSDDSSVAQFAIGAVGGALIGGLIGSSTPKWKQIYP